MRVGATIGAAVLLMSCKASDVLSVPPPADQFGSGAPTNRHDAEAAYDGARVSFFQGVAASNGLLPVGSVLTDEFTAAPSFPEIDARFTRAAALLSGSELGDGPLQQLYQARLSLLLATSTLARYEPDSSQWKVGEAFALLGYVELFMAEDYCAGMTLSYVPDAGGIVYGRPLTTDSLLATAEAHFGAALSHAHGNATIQALASVGLGRARLNRAHSVPAAAAVSGVPTTFVYNVEMATDRNGNNFVNMYTDLFVGNIGCAFINVTDHEGTNGLNFISAGDQRLVIDSTTTRRTCDGSSGLPDTPFYYPVKFGSPPTGLIPLATGVEARLIEAEAALASNAASTWASDLNALRAAAPSTYLALAAPMSSLTTDSTTGASAAEQVDVMFRERAFWLFGTGTRLGDLRRLIRQYHRDQRTVFPTGAYLLGPYGPTIPRYGSDVSLTLPTPGGNLPMTNPYYKGCLSSPATA